MLKNEQEKAEVENFSAAFPLSTDIRKGLLLRCYPVVERMLLLQDHVGAKLLFSLAEQDFVYFPFFFKCACVGYLS